MKNVPGTLLVVRKTFKSRGKSNTQPGYVLVFNEKGASYLTYGDPCLMLSYEVIEAKIKPKIFLLKVLYKKSIYSIQLKNRECNKWFATDKQWETYNYNETYKKFLDNGSLQSLWISYGLTDRLDNAL